MCVHPKTKAKLRTKLKELTSRSNGWGYEKRKEKLTYAVRGWVNYFRFAEMRNFLRETDEWQAWQWANTRKGYWRTTAVPRKN